MKTLKFMLLFFILIIIDLAAQSTYRVHINNINLPINKSGVLAAVNIPDPDPQISGSSAKLDGFVCFFAGGFFLSGYNDTLLWSNGVVPSSLVADYRPGRVGSNPEESKNKIYIISKNDLPFSLAWQEWKDAVELGATFYDGNADGVYDPIDLNGNSKWDPSEDKPDLIGDLTTWCVYNDGVPANQRRYDVEPQGIEIQQTLFAYDSSNINLSNTIFVRYRIINRNALADKMDSVFFGLWADHDIGGAGDENFGTDTLSNSIFGYNDGDDFDYGNNSPALFLTLLQFPHTYIPGKTFIDLNGNSLYDSGIDTPIDTAFLLQGSLGIKKIEGSANCHYASAMGWVNGDPVLGDPGNKVQARNYLLARLRSGEIVNPCNWAYAVVEGDIKCSDINPFFWASGNPVQNTGWIWNIPCNGRIMANTGAFNLIRDEPVDIIVAYTAVRGSNELNSIIVTREKVKKVIEHYNSNFGANTVAVKEEEQMANHYFLNQNFPNPFNPSTQLSFLIGKQSFVNLKIYDVLGNEITTLINKELSAGEHTINFTASSLNLSSGIYFYQLNAAGKIFTKKMILQK